MEDWFTNIHFGFSYVGLIFLMMLFIPNIAWTRFKPVGYEAAVKTENKILSVFERIGQVLVVALSLIFSDFNFDVGTWWASWLVSAFLLLILYEGCWVRYFRSQRTMKDMYRSFFFLPVPLAVLPVSAFLMLGIYGKNAYLIVASLVLGIGHIGIHLQHRQQLTHEE